MTTPQNPGVRRRQKARRAKQLAEWRIKNDRAKESAPEPQVAASAAKGAKVA
jgi:hypothetical protein